MEVERALVGIVAGDIDDLVKHDRRRAGVHGAAGEAGGRRRSGRHRPVGLVVDGEARRGGQRLDMEGRRTGVRDRERRRRRGGTGGDRAEIEHVGGADERAVGEAQLDLGRWRQGEGIGPVVVLDALARHRVAARHLEHGSGRGERHLAANVEARRVRGASTVVSDDELEAQDRIESGVGEDGSERADVVAVDPIAARNGIDVQPEEVGARSARLGDGGVLVADEHRDAAGTGEARRAHVEDGHVDMRLEPHVDHAVRAGDRKPRGRAPSSIAT